MILESNQSTFIYLSIYTPATVLDPWSLFHSLLFALLPIELLINQLANLPIKLYWKTRAVAATTEQSNHEGHKQIYNS